MSTFIGLSSSPDSRTNRFSTFTTPMRTTSLRRLRTAFSPTRAGGPRKTALSPERTSYISYTSSSTTPLSVPGSGNSSAEDLAGLSPAGGSGSGRDSWLDGSPSSTTSSGSKIRQVLSMRAMRRKPSVLVVEMREERRQLGALLAGHEMPMEPRPVDEMVAVGGIFEVLEGRI